VIVAIVRCRPAPPLAPLRNAPRVTIVRPVCGVDNFVEDTLASTFTLDYPRYEIIFRVAHGRDPMPTLAIAAAATGWPIGEVLAAFATMWYGAEVALAFAAGWDRPAFYAIHGALRDLLLPAIWPFGLMGTEFVWRGNAMSLLDDDIAEDAIVEDGRAI
jgi:hypothetical protein